jgi:hypothetical protein
MRPDGSLASGWALGNTRRKLKLLAAPEVASRTRVGDPLPSGGLYEFTQHNYQPMTDARHDCPGAETGLAATVLG